MSNNSSHIQTKRDFITKRITHVIEYLDLTLNDFRDITGLSEEYICKITTNKLAPKCSTLIKIAESLGVNPKYFCDAYNDDYAHKLLESSNSVRVIDDWKMHKCVNRNRVTRRIPIKSEVIHNTYFHKDTVSEDERLLLKRIRESKLTIEQCYKIIEHLDNSSNSDIEEFLNK